jgi:hypothetical protein
MLLVLLLAAAGPAEAADPAAGEPQLSASESLADVIESEAGAVLQTVPPLPAPAETAARLKAILESEEFKDEAPSGESLLDRIIKFINRLFSGLNLGPAGGALYYIGFVLIGLILVLIIYLAVRMLWGYFGAGSAAAAAVSRAQEQHFTTENWLAAAQEAWQRGDFRSAIRFRFKAVVSMLELPRSATLTNYQIARHIGREYPVLRAAMLELVTRFEDTWYGGLPAGAVDYEQVVRLAGGIEQTVAARKDQP